MAAIIFILRLQRQYSSAARALGKPLLLLLLLLHLGQALLLSWAVFKMHNGQPAPSRALHNSLSNIQSAQLRFCRAVFPNAISPKHFFPGYWVAFGPAEILQYTVCPVKLILKSSLFSRCTLTACLFSRTLHEHHSIIPSEHQLYSCDKVKYSHCK